MGQEVGLVRIERWKKSLLPKKHCFVKKIKKEKKISFKEYTCRQYLVYGDHGGSPFCTETEFDPQDRSSVPGEMNSVAGKMNSVAGETNLIPV